jgi:hypothetical protein
MVEVMDIPIHQFCFFAFVFRVTAGTTSGFITVESALG